MSRDGALPRLSDEDDEGQDELMPEPPAVSGEHGQILSFIHRALHVVQRDVKRLERLQAEGAGHDHERAEWRKSMDAWRASVDEKLSAIAASVGDSGATGWRVLTTQRNLPLTMMGVLVLFLCAVLWGVLFGPRDVEHKIDHIRGNAPAAEVPARE